MLSAIPLNLAQAQQLQLPEGLTNLQVAALQQLAGHAPHLQAPDPTQPPPKKKRRSKVKSRLGKRGLKFCASAHDDFHKKEMAFQYDRYVAGTTRELLQ